MAANVYLDYGPSTNIARNQVKLHNLLGTFSSTIDPINLVITGRIRNMIMAIKDTLGFLWDLGDDTVEFAKTDDPSYRKKLKKFLYTPAQSRFHIFQLKGGCGR